MDTKSEVAQPEPAACEHEWTSPAVQCWKCEKFSEVEPARLARDMTAFDEAALRIYCAIRSMEMYGHMSLADIRIQAFTETRELLAALKESNDDA